MKKSLSLQLDIAELIYDIQNKTYLTGRSLGNSDNHAHVANMQANDDDENEAQILRSITSAVALLRTKLSEYMESNDGTSDNSILEATANIRLNLEMPSNFNSSVTKAIGEAVHQFIVAAAIADWFAITAKGETADYKSVADTSIAVIEEALCKRLRPLRNQA